MSKRPVVATAAVCLVVGALGGSLVPRLLDGDETPPLVATMTGAQTEDRIDYRFSEWWTDGSTALQLLPREGGMTVSSPFVRDLSSDTTNVEADGIEDDDVEPGALAAVPGDPEAGWAAVGVPDDSDGSRPDDEVARALVWSGDTDSDDPVGPQELPVDVVAQRSDGGTPYVQLALASSGETTNGLAYVSQDLGSGVQREEVASGLLWCDVLSDCTWEQTPLPGGTGSAVLGSTGEGYVLAAQEDGETQLWSTGADELSWEKVGDVTTGRDLVLLQDGPEGATLVWRHHGEEPRELSVQTVDRSGELGDEVRATAPDHQDVRSVARIDDAWLIGASDTAGPGFELAYDPVRPLLLRLGDDADEWTEVHDPLLTSQLDQSVVALLPAHDEDGSADGVRMATTSAVQRITMLWRLDPED